jgi:hypothetical protein
MTNNNAATDNDIDDGEHHPTCDDDEPNWNNIMLHEPARSEVPNFLAARSRLEGANERFVIDLDTFHEALKQSMGGLIDVVTLVLNDRADRLVQLEENLKYDYIHNEKTRSELQAKLEESARAAQGLFASLLMRVAQPKETFRDSGAAGKMMVDNSTKPNGGGNAAGLSNDDENEMENDDPNWDTIMQHEPARSEVPTYLDASSRRDISYSRFEAAIDEFQRSLDGCVQEFTQAIADVYNTRQTKLEEYEHILKHDYVSNDKNRAEMQSKLEESAAAAHTMFEELMARVMEPRRQLRVAGVLTQATTLGDSP